MAEAKAVKARFVGDPRNPGEARPDLVDAYGTTFQGDKFSEVVPELADKVRGNDHFEVQGEKAEKPVETAESTNEFSGRVNDITDREGLEAMLAAEKRPGAKAVLEQRLALLPVA